MIQCTLWWKQLESASVIIGLLLLSQVLRHLLRVCFGREDWRARAAIFVEPRSELAAAICRHQFTKRFVCRSNARGVLLRSLDQALVEIVLVIAHVHAAFVPRILHFGVASIFCQSCPPLTLWHDWRSQETCGLSTQFVLEAEPVRCFVRDSVRIQMRLIKLFWVFLYGLIQNIADVFVGVAGGWSFVGLLHGTLVGLDMEFTLLLLLICYRSQGLPLVLNVCCGFLGLDNLLWLRRC